MLQSRIQTANIPRWQAIAMQFALVTAGALALALSANVKIPLPPVPATMQVMVVLLLGATLGPRMAALAILEYVALGATGLPFFACNLMVTGGFLFGFLLAAPLFGALCAHVAGSYPARLMKSWLAALPAIAVIYLCGWSWLAFDPLHFGPLQAFIGGIAPFILLDLVKAAFVAAAINLRGKETV